MNAEAKMKWGAPVAETNWELMCVLASASHTLKNQAIASPVFKDKALDDLRDKISTIADEIHGLQALIPVEG